MQVSVRFSRGAGLALSVARKESATLRAFSLCFMVGGSHMPLLAIAHVMEGARYHMATLGYYRAPEAIRGFRTSRYEGSR